MWHDEDISFMQEWHMKEKDELREQLQEFRQSLQESVLRESLLSEQLKRLQTKIKTSAEQNVGDLAEMQETFSLIIADVDRVTVLLDDPNEDSRVSVAEILGDIRMRAHARVYEINEQTDAFYKESEDNII